jgi:hypothetical protein
MSNTHVQTLQEKQVHPEDYCIVRAKALLSENEGLI